MEKSPWRQLKEKLLNSSKYVSPDAAKDKKRFKIEVEDFVMKHKNMLRKMEKDCLKETGGSVKSVPADFRPDIEDDRERKKEYLRFARESIRSSKNYQARKFFFPQSLPFSDHC